MNWNDLDPIAAVQRGIGWANEQYRRMTGGGTDSWYVGTDGAYFGNLADQKMGYNYGNARSSSTTAYKANAAGTANKIAQGGMTKDDILKYNIKHPNEIAGDSPANTTALNTNTALRSK